MSRSIHHSKTAEAVTPERKKGAHSEAKRSVAVDSVAVAISSALKRRELRQKSMIGLYSLRVGDGMFGLPYCAVSDHFALLAQKQILPLSDCYKVGLVCLLDGKITPIAPVIVNDVK